MNKLCQAPLTWRKRLKYSIKGAHSLQIKQIFDDCKEQAKLNGILSIPQHAQMNVLHLFRASD
ncbi:uncharacterized protein N7506_012187 [Penicillium brevicompactum]|uniref:uncharacterized protein n=1 Tax=Penicillium brevicompactum TaxID=5074 RepID=UPI0025423733|nr:uncharacterized protein N7506_012187 [Penicillium brevicompactum]KAJ5319483.1 hypothetical protein N7506_012187 [Penicillium brevicompactum]